MTLCERYAEMDQMSGMGLVLAGGRSIKKAKEACSCHKDDEDIEMYGDGILDALKSFTKWLFGAIKSGEEEPKREYPKSESRKESPYGSKREEPKPEPKKEKTPDEKEIEKIFKMRCSTILAEYGITDMKTFRRWALRHHPDKVPQDRKLVATELFKRIKQCMDREGIGSGLKLAGQGFFSDDFVKRAIENDYKRKAMRVLLAMENDRKRKEMQSGKGLTDLITKYHRISKNLGIKPEDAIKQIKEKAKEKGLIKGSGLKQSGAGFWDFLSVLSVLPVPFFSDVARTVSLIATPIRVAIGDFTPALDGLVTDTMRQITDIFPQSIQETIFAPATAFAESVGLGLKLSGEGLHQDGGRAPTPMEKVKLLYHIHKKVNEVKDKINKLPAEQAKKILDMGRKSKEVADFVMIKMRLPTLEQLEEAQKKQIEEVQKKQMEEAQKK